MDNTGETVSPIGDSIVLNNFSSSTHLTPKENDFEEDYKSYNPYEHRIVDKPNTTFGSLLHIIKSSLGSGILAMPMAFSHGGTAFGFVASIIVCYICAYCVEMLVETSYEICKKTKVPMLAYSETVEQVLEYGPSKLRNWSKFSKNFCDYALIVAYYGALCVYILIIADSLQSVIEFYSDMKWDIRIYICFATLAVLLVAQVRELKYLVPFSGLANVFILITLAIFFYNIFRNDLVFSDKKLVAPWQEWPVFFSTVIFTMEGIGTMMPIANSMKKPEQFLGWQCPNVLYTGMIVNAILFTFVGFFGYVSFGDNIKTNFVLNLPTGHILSQIAQILMGLAIWLTFGLQFFAPTETIFNKLNLNKRIPANRKNLAQILIRSLICVLLGILTIVIPDLKPFIGLIGSIFLSLLGLFIPCVIDTIFLWPNFGVFKWKLIKNIILGAFSIIALIAGTIISVDDIIELYSSNNS